MHESPDLTELVAQARGGDSAASHRMIELVHRELHGLAAHMMKGEWQGHTLQPTALVNEACLRLFDQKAEWADRRHFLAVAGTVMRRVLADHARRKGASKRGAGWQRVTLDGQLSPIADETIDLLALDAALENLSALHERQARIVELRFFAGMTVEEVAGELGVSRSTAEAEWRGARAWLLRELRTSGNDRPG